MRLHVVILAAGKGTRMRSALPKVLHPLAGRPVLGHVLERAHRLGAESADVVYGHGGEQVPRSFPDEGVRWVLQEKQLGTGHALQQAMPHVADDSVVLVLYGDVPMVEIETLRSLVDAAAEGSLALLTADVDDPAGYGRIIRDPGGRVVRIVERKDANEIELAIKEVNTGFMAARANLFRRWLSRLDNTNAQGEYYLTDVVALAVGDGIPVEARKVRHQWEFMGVNSRAELAELERIFQQNQARTLMSQGVSLLDPNRFDLRGELQVGRDCVIDVNVIFEGKVTLGDEVTIGANTLIRNCHIASNTTVREHCVLEDAMVGTGCIIGPYARIRPGTRLEENVHVGNFVELKKSDVGSGSKINHLSYVGDAEIGRGVNIGAGAITCNYDGADKHRTIVGDNAFVGSNSALVAPVRVGQNATIGAGSVVTRDAPDGELTLTRSKQLIVPGWKRPVKK
jgi:bifunctional UDP-N-acetylglucosamine pyrophosphorylase/glucosamine-1-phosphate N-acetyltransferase